MGGNVSKLDEDIHINTELGELYNNLDKSQDQHNPPLKSHHRKKDQETGLCINNKHGPPRHQKLGTIKLHCTSSHIRTN